MSPAMEKRIKSLKQNANPVKRKQSMTDFAKPGAAIEVVMGAGLKFDSDKPHMDLLCPFAMEDLSKMLTFGAQKYASRNWTNGITTGRLIAGALRHLFAHARGENVDPETGLHHVAHAKCSCVFSVGMPHYIDEQDDRLLRKGRS